MLRIYLAVSALFFATLAFTVSGCSSTPTPPDSTATEAHAPGVATSQVDAPTEASEADPAATSDVLERKSHPTVRCPKKAHLVKGKCVLDMEDAD
jgi:hypothetical protein